MRKRKNSIDACCDTDTKQSRVDASLHVLSSSSSSSSSSSETFTIKSFDASQEINDGAKLASLSHETPVPYLLQDLAPSFSFNSTSTSSMFTPKPSSVLPLLNQLSTSQLPLSSSSSSSSSSLVSSLTLTPTQLLSLPSSPLSSSSSPSSFSSSSSIFYSSPCLASCCSPMSSSSSSSSSSFSSSFSSSSSVSASSPSMLKTEAAILSTSPSTLTPPPKINTRPATSSLRRNTRVMPEVLRTAVQNYNTEHSSGLTFSRQTACTGKPSCDSTSCVAPLQCMGYINMLTAKMQHEALRGESQRNMIDKCMAMKADLDKSNATVVHWREQYRQISVMNYDIKQEKDKQTRIAQEEQTQHLVCKKKLAQVELRSNDQQKMLEDAHTCVQTAAADCLMVSRELSDTRRQLALATSMCVELKDQVVSLQLATDPFIDEHNSEMRRAHEIDRLRSIEARYLRVSSMVRQLIAAQSNQISGVSENPCPSSSSSSFSTSSPSSVSSSSSSPSSPSDYTTLSSLPLSPLSFLALHSPYSSYDSITSFPLSTSPLTLLRAHSDESQFSFSPSSSSASLYSSCSPSSSSDKFKLSCEILAQLASECGSVV